MRNVWVVAILFGTGCATTRVECRDHGGREWYEARSEHFHLRSNLSRDDASAELQEYEQVLHAIRWAMDYSGSIPVIEAVVVGPGELARFKYGGTSGVAFRGSTPRIVLEAHNDAPMLGTVVPRVSTHELTHVVADVSFPSIPLWLNEGLAQYLETTTFSSLTEVKIGAGIYGRQLQVKQLGLAPLDALERWGTNADFKGVTLDQLYATSWAYVHYLINHERERFNAALTAIRRGEPSNESFRKVFPDFNNELTLKVRKYVSGGKITVEVFPLPKPVSAPVAVPITPAEVHVARREIWDLSPWLPEDQRRIQRRAELSLATQVRGGDTLPVTFAQASEGTLSWEEAEKRFPNDPAIKAQLVLNYHWGIQGNIEKLAAALERQPDDDLVRGRLGVELLLVGKNTEGLALLDDLSQSVDSNAVVHAIMGSVVVRDCQRLETLMRHLNSMDRRAAAQIAKVKAICELPAAEPQQCEPRAKGMSNAVLTSTMKRYHGVYSTLFAVIGEHIDLMKFRLDAELTVEKDGRVSAAKVRLEPASPILERAFTGFATAMVFPPPCDGKQARAKIQIGFGDEPKSASTPES